MARYPGQADLLAIHSNTQYSEIHNLGSQLQVKKPSGISVISPHTEKPTPISRCSDPKSMRDNPQNVSQTLDKQLKCPSSPQSAEYFGQSSTFDFMAKVCLPIDEEPKYGVSSSSQQDLRSSAHSNSLAMSSPSALIFDGSFLSLGGNELFSLPSRIISDRMVDSYFKLSHPLNTYLHEHSFRRRYELLWIRESQGGEEAKESNMAWFGVINMVFAFGADHTKPFPWAATGPTQFYKLAKTLVFSSIFQAASIERVQALLLIGQYLHASLELDNARTVVSLAIRMAQNLGLHLNTTCSNLETIDKEVCKRVWWGCFTLDCLLSMKVGRPPTIHSYDDSTISLPLAVDDEYITNDCSVPIIQPPENLSKFAFQRHAISLCRLLQRICSALYNEYQPDNINKPGVSDLPKLLGLSIQLDSDLTSWQQTLPPQLQFDSQIPGGTYERQRSTLLMRHVSPRVK